MPFDLPKKYYYSRDKIASHETPFIAQNLLPTLHVLANTLLIRGEKVIYHKLSWDSAAVHTLCT